jgi:hypothetical protein
MKLLLPSQIAAHLEKSAKHLRAELERVESAIAALAGGQKKLGRPPGKVKRSRRKMSAAGRAAIAKAQKARWAKIKAAKKK